MAHVAHLSGLNRALEVYTTVTNAPPLAVVGRAAKRAMETSAGQKVAGFCGKVRQFSKGLIGKALGNAVKAVAVDGAGFAAGGATATAVLAESALTPYVAPAAVAVAAGAAAYKSKSKKVRVLSAALGLVAIAGAIIAYTSGDNREGAASHLQNLGLMLGVKAGQALGSFAAQRFVLGTKIDRYKMEVDGWGRERPKVVESYPIRFVDFDQPLKSHALLMTQYFVGKSVLPCCFIGESAARDGLLGTLAYSAVPLHNAYNGFRAGRERGLQGKVTDLAMDFIDDPKMYAHTLSRALLEPITPEAPRALKNAFALVLKNIPDQFIVMGEKLLTELRKVLAQLPAIPGLEKMILKVLMDLPRIVSVVMHSLNEFGDIVRNSEKIQKLLAEPEVNIDAINDAIGEEIVKKYPSLNITDGALAKALTPLAGALAKIIVDTQTMITGIPLHADKMQSHDMLIIYLKYLLMGIVTNYSATVMHYNDKGGRLTHAEGRDFLKNTVQLFVSDARLLPEPVATVTVKAANVFADVNYALAPAPRPIPQVKKGLLGRIAAWIGDKFNTLSKAIFGTVCKVIGAAHRIFSSK